MLLLFLVKKNEHRMPLNIVVPQLRALLPHLTYDEAYALAEKVLAPPNKEDPVVIACEGEEVHDIVVMDLKLMLV